MTPIFRTALALSLLSVAAASNAQSIVYSDAFDSVGGWPDSDATGDLDAVYTVVGGEYLINPLQDRHYALAMAPAHTASGDQSVEADVRLAASNPDSRAGVACRASAGLNFYAFNLVKGGGYEIVRVANGNATSLTHGALGLDPAEGVRLRAECRGAALSLAVNGRVLATVSDTGLPPATGAGLLSVSPVIAATNAAFDNFQLGDFGGGSAAPAQARQVPTSRSVPAAATGGGNGGGSGGYDAATPVIDDMAVFNDVGGQPGAHQSLFENGRQRVYIVLELAANPRAHYRAQWSRVNGTDEAVLLNSTMDNSAGHRRVWMYADRNWSAGLYRVDVYANERLVDQREFSVF